MEQLSEVIQQVPLGICVTDVPSLRIEAANREFAALAGASDGASLTGTLTVEPAEGLLARLVPLWKVTMRTGEASPRTTLAVDGERPRCIEVECRPLRTAEGDVYALVTTARDVAEKRPERDPDDSQQCCRVLFEDDPHPMWVFDLETLRFLAVNDAAMHLYGYSRSEFLAMTIKEIRLAEDVPALLEKVAKGKDGLDVGGTWRHRKRDGTLIFVEITSHTTDFAGRRARVVTAHDVTERRKAERELRRTTSELNAIFRALPDLYFHTSADGTILNYRGGSAADLYVPPEEFLGRRMQDVIPAKAAAALQHGLHQALESRCLCTVEYPLEVGGEERVYEARMVPLLDDEGIVVVRDITERKRADTRVRDSEANYRAIFDTANDAIFVHDMETGAILDVNHRMYEMYGFTPEEACRLTVGDLSAGVPPYTQEGAAEWIARAASGEPQVFEWRARRKDGELFWVEVNLKRAVVGGRDRLLALVRDVTERKRAEEQLSAAYQRIIEADTERKHFYREVIRAVTNDKLRLVSAAEIPAEAPPALELRLEGPQDYSRLRRGLGEMSRGAGMSPEHASDLVLAAGEAATNAIKHATDGRCTVSLTADRVIVRVSDRGSGIRPEDLPGAVLLPGYSTRISLGMGYTIMLRLVDHVWLATGHEGTVVQLEKRIHPETQPEPCLAAAWERL